jgi:hypothetical protein
MRTRFPLGSGAVAVALVTAACLPSARPTSESTSSAQTQLDVQYWGGPVLSHVKVHTVYWGAGVPDQDRLNRFYGDVTDSPYFDWLTEYDTPTQTIGRGSFAGAFVDPSPPAGTRITDQMVQDELARLIDGGSLPAPGADDLFMVHFPPSVLVSTKAWWSHGQTMTTCAQLCGYHAAFSHGGTNVYYAVLPDLGGACAGGCGDDADKFHNQTATASHELVEAVTDPAISLATGVGAPLAWWDPNKMEIGDICEFDALPLGQWTVQAQFSNKWHDCIATSPSMTDLSNGVAVTGISGASHHFPQFKIDVPEGAENLVFTLRKATSGANGAEMLINYGAPAARDRLGWQAGSGADDGPWTAKIPSPHAGTYYVLVTAFFPDGSFAGNELEASYQLPSRQ